MTAIRIIDDHVQLASIGTKTHVQIEGHIQGIGNYAFPAADGAADQVLKTNGAGVLAWIDKNHSVASHSDTTATGAELETLTNNSIANALHRHSELVASDGSPDPALQVDATGQVGIGGIPDQKLTVLGGNVNIKNQNYPQYLLTSNLGGAQIWSFQSSANDCYIKNVTNTKYILKIKNDAPNNCLVIDASGHIGLGTANPTTSAKLELNSTTGALLLTRTTTAQIASPVNGMLLYDSTLNKFQGYENGAWVSLI